MAFPWIFEGTFPTGSVTDGGWDSETDTGSQLFIDHYSELARLPYPTAAPFDSSAYCARISLTGGTADAFITEADVNISDTATTYFRFPIWFSPDFDATANDTFAILELQGSGNAVTTSIGVRYVAASDVINIGTGSAASGAVPDNFAGISMRRGIWYTIEAKVNVETDASGTTDIWITEAGKTQQGTADIALTDQTHIAVTHAVYGIQDQLATTTGVILLGPLMQDDAQIFAQRDRYPDTVVLTKTGQVAVGPGEVDSFTLMPGAATDGVLTIYDTDNGLTQAADSLIAEIKNVTNSDPVTRDRRLQFQRGCYVTLAGTTPRATIQIARSAYRTPGAIRILGQGRTLATP